MSDKCDEDLQLINIKKYLSSCLTKRHIPSYIEISHRYSDDVEYLLSIIDRLKNK